MKKTLFQIVSLLLVFPLVANPSLAGPLTFPLPSPVERPIFSEQALAVRALAPLRTFTRTIKVIFIKWIRMGSAANQKRRIKNQIRRAAYQFYRQSLLNRLRYVGQRIAEAKSWNSVPNNKETDELIQFIRERLQTEGRKLHSKWVYKAAEIALSAKGHAGRALPHVAFLHADVKVRLKRESDKDTRMILTNLRDAIEHLPQMIEVVEPEGGLSPYLFARQWILSYLLIERIRRISPGAQADYQARGFGVAQLRLRVHTETLGEVLKKLREKDPLFRQWDIKFNQGPRGVVYIYFQRHLGHIQQTALDRREPLKETTLGSALYLVLTDFYYAITRPLRSGLRPVWQFWKNRFSTYRNVPFPAVLPWLGLGFSVASIFFGVLASKLFLAVYVNGLSFDPVLLAFAIISSPIAMSYLEWKAFTDFFFEPWAACWGSGLVTGWVIYGITWIIHIPIIKRLVEAGQKAEPSPKHVQVYRAPTEPDEIVRPQYDEKSLRPGQKLIAPILWEPDAGGNTRDYDVGVISDTHLKDPHVRWKLIKDMLTHNRFKRLILLGDIIDYEVSRDMPDEQREVIQMLLNLADQGVELVYVPGNHDARWRARIGKGINLKAPSGRKVHIPVRLYERLTLEDGRIVHLEHGDGRDGLVLDRKTLQHLGSWAVDSLLELDNWVIKQRELRGIHSDVSYTIFGKHWVKEWLKDYRDRAVSAAQRRGADIVILGHNHIPEMRILDGMLYINAGDSQNPLHSTMVGIRSLHPGQAKVDIELLEWEMTVEEARAASLRQASPPASAPKRTLILQSAFFTRFRTFQRKLRTAA